MTEHDDATTREQPDVPREARPSAADRRRAEEQSSRREPRFGLERLMGRDGPAIVTAAFDGTPPPYATSRGVMAGAFYGKDADEDGLTRAEVRNAVEAYLSHPDESTQEG
jgi:hypothetical protein